MKIIFLIVLFFSSHLFPQDKNFTINTLSNEEVELKKLYENGPVLVSFWALWCEPCKAEMKHLQRIYEEYKNDGFTILGINQDSPRSVSKVRSYISSQKITFPVALDPNYRYLQKMNGQSIPYSLLFDSQGKIVYKHVGYLPGDEIKLEDEIRKLLPEKN